MQYMLVRWILGYVSTKSTALSLRKSSSAQFSYYKINKFQLYIIGDRQNLFLAAEKSQLPPSPKKLISPNTCLCKWVEMRKAPALPIVVH